jgi:predicted nuclease of predicted toxin-antitoxin system
VKIWIDAQISPAIAQWFSSTYGVEAVALKDLGLRDANDRDIFFSARDAKTVVLTKDRDLVDLVIQLGSPPQILWVTCGNTSNAKLKAILMQAWPSAVTLLRSGEKIIEVSDMTT